MPQAILSGNLQGMFHGEIGAFLGFSNCTLMSNCIACDWERMLGAVFVSGLGVPFSFLDPYLPSFNVGEFGRTQIGAIEFG